MIITSRILENLVRVSSGISVRESSLKTRSIPCARFVQLRLLATVTKGGPTFLEVNNDETVVTSRMTEKFELLTSRFLPEFLSVIDISSKDTSSSFQCHFRQESYSSRDREVSAFNYCRENIYI